MRAAILALCTALGACTQFPDLVRRESPEAARAPYPDLAPLTPLLARAEGGALAEPGVTEALQGRGDALRARRRAPAGGGQGLADRGTALRERAEALRGG